MNKKSLLSRIIIFSSVAGAYFFLILVLAAISEMARMYNAASSVHPVLGIVLIMLLAAPAVFLVVQGMGIWVQVPKLTAPPPPIEETGLSRAQYNKKVRVYARLVGRNLKQNPLLQSPTDQICIDTALTALDSASDDAVLDQLWKDQTISIRAKLDSAADKVIAESNAKITIGVAASQSSAIDALIQLYGMWQLTFKIVKVYWTRPGLMVLVQLSRDIIASSAHLFTVSMATESALFQRVIQGAGRLVQRGGQIVAASGEPISGVVATGLGQLIATVGDDAAQAAISRHRTRVYGQGVKARCTAIEWNGVQETASLVDRFVTALKRVKDTEGNEAPAEGDTHDSGTEAEQAFKLLQSLSWEGRKGSQDLRILGVMVDLINEDTPEDKRINLLTQARSEPKVGGVKRMFGLSKKPTTVVGYSKQALGLVVARTKQLQDDPSLFTEEQNALFSKVAAGLKPSEPAFVE